jgi:hypothetical protein
VSHRSSTYSWQLSDRRQGRVCRKQRCLTWLLFSHLISLIILVTNPPSLALSCNLDNCLRAYVVFSHIHIATSFCATYIPPGTLTTIATTISSTTSYEDFLISSDSPPQTDYFTYTELYVSPSLTTPFINFQRIAQEKESRRQAERDQADVYNIRKIHHRRRHPPSPYHNKHSTHHNNYLPTVYVRMRLRCKKDEQRMLVRFVVCDDGVEDCVCPGVCAVALRECFQLRRG